MSEVLVGTAYWLAQMRYQQFDQGVSHVEQQIKRLQAMAAQPITFGASVAGGAGGGGAGVPRLPAAGGTSGGAGDYERQQRALAGLEQKQASLARTQGDAARAAALEAQAQERLTNVLSQQAAGSTQAIATQKQLVSVQQQAARAAQSGGGGGFGSALKSTVSVVDTAIKGFIALRAATASLDFLRVGAQASDARRSLDGLAEASGRTGQAIVSSLRDAAQGTIRDTQLIQSANTGLLLTQGRIAKELPQLVEIARASAKATGQDVGFIFDSLVRGIARGSPMIIDNAGITLDAAGAFETYAKSIGKSADQLTKQEQQQATLNAVLKSGSEIVKQVGLDADSSATKIDRAVTAVQNLGDALAQRIAPFVGQAAQGIADIINTGTPNAGAQIAGGGVQAQAAQTATSYEQYAQRIQAANQSISASFASDPVAGFLARQLYGLQALTPAQYAYAQSLIASGTAADHAVQQAQALAQIDAGLAPIQIQAARAGGEIASSYQRLIPLMFDVSSMSASNAEQVRAAADAFTTGDISAQQFEQILRALANVHNLAAQQASYEATENNRLSKTFYALVPAANAAAAAIGRLQDQSNAAARGFGRTAIAGGAGGLAGALGGGAGAEANRFFGELDQLQASRAALAMARAKTHQQRLAILQQQLARQATEEGRNRVLAQIEAEKQAIANEKTHGAGRVSAAATTGDQLLRIEENSQEQIAKAQREGLERLRDQEEDYLVGRTRKQEDFQREYVRLLARGERAQAAQLKEKFDRDQQRDQEDFDRQRRRTLRNNAESLGDITGRADLQTSQTERRAALRGVRATGTAATAGQRAEPTAIAAGGAGGGGGVVALNITFQPTAVQIDGHTIVEMTWPEIHEKVDTALAAELNIIIPSSGQIAVAGVHP